MLLVASALRFVLATVFFLGGLAKLSAGDRFELAVRRYEVVPARFARPTARLVTGLELALACVLFGGVGIREAAIVVTAVLLVFTGAIVINLLRGRSFDCGCSIVGASEVIGWTSVTRNLVLAAAAAAIAVDVPRALAIDDYLTGRAPGLSSGAAGGTAIVGCTAVLIAALLQAAARASAALGALPPGQFLPENAVAKDGLR